MKAREVAAPLATLMIAAALLTASPRATRAESGAFPTRVLITNDNGVADPKIVALARAFAARSETWVVAPSRDRSGSGAHLSITHTGELSLQPHDLGDGIVARAVDGLPADCVVLALFGMMKDRPPDLVVSGINGGPNLGSDWMFSGTVGAARVAALAGVPAIAVSGLDDDLPGSVEAAVSWVVRLAASTAARELQPGEYLTVSLPRTAPDRIRGVRWANRAPLRATPLLAPGEDPARWRLIGLQARDSAVPDDSDQAAYDSGYVAVVPMRADEVDHGRLARRGRSSVDLPDWDFIPAE
jgi:5'-nucleotidase